MKRSCANTQTEKARPGRYTTKMGWIYHPRYQWTPAELLWDRELDSFVHPDGSPVTKENQLEMPSINPQIPITEEDFGANYTEGAATYVVYTTPMLMLTVEELNAANHEYRKVMRQYKTGNKLPLRGKKGSAGDKIM